MGALNAEFIDYLLDVGVDFSVSVVKYNYGPMNSKFYR
mgnify:CR=1 FL=1